MPEFQEQQAGWCGRHWVRERGDEADGQEKPKARRPFRSLKNFDFYSEMGSLCFIRILCYSVAKRAQGSRTEVRRLVRMILQQSMHSSSGHGKKWPDSINILKAELTGFGLDVGVRGKGAKDDSSASGWTELPFTEQTVGRAGLGRERWRQEFGFGCVAVQAT